MQSTSFIMNVSWKVTEAARAGTVCRRRLSVSHSLRFSNGHLDKVALMSWYQRSTTLPAYSRGFHLITPKIVAAIPEIAKIDIGLLHVFIQHTSASLTINENADPDVRIDLETSISAIAPEDFLYVHTMEGPDDMPAHVKASLLGSSVSIPISQGRLTLGTWQGVYLCEHRDHAGPRRLVLTLHGDP